ncbi:MAG: type III PLP-dependent enzyme domain-containing protein [Candidatus Doudnabacteria bacterium]
MNTRLLAKAAKKVGTPLFIYDKQVLLDNVKRVQVAIKKNGLEHRLKIYLAYFANSNPQIFKLLENKGLGVVLQSKEELYQIDSFGLNFDYVLSPSFLSDEEIDYWVRKKIQINLASLEDVQYFLSKYPKEKLNFRLDLSQEQSQRAAIKLVKIKELQNLLAKYNHLPNSFHIYVGTGSSLRKMKYNLNKALNIYKKYFPGVKLINLGGGFGFDYVNTDSRKKHFKWDSYLKYLSTQIKKMNLTNDLSFVIEPGRDIFADFGSLFLNVKRVMISSKQNIIATDGSYVLIPSATIRERKHNVQFYSKDFRVLNPSKSKASLSGNTTLSSDYVFPAAINFPKDLKHNSFVLIKDLGAYAATQHMEFLNQKPCAEVLIDRKSYF